MSFILDALKKSESDRQRQSGPSLFEVKVAPPRRALPIWAVAIAVLLGINAIVVSWMLLRRGPAQQPAAAAPAAKTLLAAPTGSGAPGSGSGPLATGSTSGAAAPAAVAAAPAKPPAASAVTPAAAAPAGIGSPAAAGRQPPAVPQAVSPSDQSTGPPPTSGDAGDYAPAEEPAAAQASGGTGTDGTLPIYQQVVTTDGLPALHLDLHVFAKLPKDRFVMINMQRLQEGDSLPNGVQVQAIRPDGVVLSYHGTRFLLPRD